jgi:hypothetical protein
LYKEKEMKNVTGSKIQAIKINPHRAIYVAGKAAEATADIN